jgi:hypothetical protein
VTTIGPAAELAQLLRTQLAQRGVRAAPAGPTEGNASAAARASAPAAASPTGYAPDENLLRRVAAIDPQDPQRRRKALRLFLESVLRREWGASLINDAGFHQLVATVQSQMESEPQLAAAIAAAGDELLAARKG